VNFLESANRDPVIVSSLTVNREANAHNRIGDSSVDDLPGFSSTLVGSAVIDVSLGVNLTL